MSREKGYLQTISCSISLSSCRVRAESLARALNSRLWPIPGLRLDPRGRKYDTLLTAQRNTATSCSATASVVDKPPRSIDMFKTADGYERGHCWVNELPTEDDESYDTPPCSSPPSPADNEIIVNPPTSLPFCKLLIDSPPNADPNRYGKNHSIFSDEAKLRDKLQQYADSLFSDTEGAETFYDACENEIRDDVPAIDRSHSPPGDDDCSSTTGLTDEGCVSDISIEVHPPEKANTHSDPEKDPACKNLFVDRRLREVQDLVEDERPRLLRSTSLKTGKTPPGTPSRKKIVRFADVLGLDLEAVRHIVCEDLPHVPSSAFDDLDLPPEQDDHPNLTPPEKTLSVGWGAIPATSCMPLSSLYPLFATPGTERDFLDRVRRDWVCLESITVSVMSVHCICRVKNVAYEKQVAARYTTDDWRTWDEVLASYIPFSSDGEFDMFSFSLYLKPGTQENERLSFAIRFKAGNLCRWDNNGGENYTLRYAGSENATNLTLPTHEIEEPWLYHFC